MFQILRKKRMTLRKISQASNGTELISDETTGYAEFGFTGTGVDIYANCDTDTGMVNILVKNDDTGRIVKFIVVDTVAKGKGSATQGQDVESYHLPIASISMEHGSYTVQIRHCKSADSETKPVRLDGFRVYNTLSDSTVFQADHESDPNFLEMRNVVMNSYSLQEAVAELESEYVTAEELAAVVQKQVIDVTENGVGITALILDENTEYTSEYVQDLLDNGPKNEVFLFKDQSLVFTLSPGLKNVQLGLKAVDGTVAYTLNGEEKTLSSSTDMFYELCDSETLTEACTITIKNTSDSILSVTDLKWFIGSDSGSAAPLTELDQNGLTEALKFMGYSSKTEGVIRIAGAGRIDTAMAAANMYKEKIGAEKFDAVVVATGENFADAMTGSYLASVNNAPILLINEKRMDDVVSYVNDNLSEDGKVYILGGESAIPLTLEEKLGAYDVQRLAGKNRYETNIAILDAAGVSGGEMIVATGRDFADSLSASAVKRPVLLVKDKLSSAQQAYLETLDVERFYIVGGVKAVSTTVESQLKAFGDTERLAGANRMETSVIVAEKFFENPDMAVIAGASTFADGLCGGALAAVMNAPLILTLDGKTASAAGYVQGNGIQSGYVLGGVTAIKDETVVSVFGLGSTEDIFVVK